MSTGELIHGIGRRFREERERLGFSRPDIANAIGTSSDTVKNWEGGKTSVNAAALRFLSDNNGDVLYIVTGRHGPLLVAEPDQPAPALNASQRAANKISLMHLSEEDADLVTAVARRLSKNG